MQWSKVLLLSLGLLLPMACKEKEKEHPACTTARVFAERFYNFRIMECRELCLKDLGPHLEHRNHLMQDEERRLFAEAGPAKVRIVHTHIEDENLRGYVDVEISNFVCINFWTNKAFIEDCDTFRILMEKDYFGWHLIHIP